MSSVFIPVLRGVRQNFFTGQDGALRYLELAHLASVKIDYYFVIAIIYIISVGAVLKIDARH